jgi:hypothetical protein
MRWKGKKNVGLRYKTFMILAKESQPSARAQSLEFGFEKQPERNSRLVNGKNMGRIWVGIATILLVCEQEGSLGFLVKSNPPAFTLIVIP